AATQPAPVGYITRPVEPNSAPDDGAYDTGGVGDITHPDAPHHEPQDTPRGHGDVSDITHPATPPAVVTDDVVGPERQRGGEPAPEGAIPGRTVPVQAHERRIGVVDDSRSHVERVLAGSLAEIRACFPLTAADKAKGRAFAAEVLALIDATEEEADAFRRSH
ncbi:MAG: hypothetical protein M3Y74_22090, partial [Chloroflexota bacterium]|nr:hypothetical protein [Chloroflexota bacterium]